VQKATPHCSRFSFASSARAGKVGEAWTLPPLGALCLLRLLGLPARI
jgi:hypothetical protein